MLKAAKHEAKQYIFDLTILPPLVQTEMIKNGQYIADQFVGFFEDFPQALFLGG